MNKNKKETELKLKTVINEFSEENKLCDDQLLCFIAIKSVFNCCFTTKIVSF